VDKDATMEPPIHTQNFLSGAATIFVIIFFGIKADIWGTVFETSPNENYSL
jgi:hypothetical protein